MEIITFASVINNDSTHHSSSSVVSSVNGMLISNPVQPAITNVPKQMASPVNNSLIIIISIGDRG